MQALEHLPGRQDETLRICEELSDVPNEGPELWSSKRVTDLLRLVGYFTRRQLWSKSETKLRDYLTRLYSFQNETSADQAVLRATGDVAFCLSRLLSDRSLKEDAIEVLMKLWSCLEQHLLLTDETEISRSMMPHFRLIAEELRPLGAMDQATSILTKLRAWYIDHQCDTSDEALLVSLALAKFHQLRNDKEDAQSLLESLYANLMGECGLRPEAFGLAGLSVCLDLASLYSTASRMSDAIDVCTGVLQTSWPSIIEGTSVHRDISTQQSRQTIHIAVLLTSLLKRSGKASEAEAMALRLQQAMLARLAVRDAAKVEEAEWFADVSEDLGSAEEAIGFWKALRTSCHYGTEWGREFLARVNLRLARLYRHSNSQESEAALIDIIQELDSDYSPECSASRNEAILALCDYYEKQQKHNELRKWYFTLWSSYLNQRIEAGVSGERGMQLFNKYVTVLLKLQDNSGAVRLARELRAVFVAEFGASDVFSIKASTELAILLEKSSTTRNESVSLYEDICKLPVDDADADIDARAEAIRRARRRLADILTSRPDLAHRAEGILTESWEEAMGKFGSSGKQTLASLKALIDFYRKQGSRKHTALALKKLEVAVREIFAHERNLRKLFSSAEEISKMYFEMNGQSSAFQLIYQHRATFAKRQDGVPLIAPVISDRRCLVFINTLELMLKRQSGSTLFADVVSDVLVETSLYESWILATRSTSTLEIKLSIGGQLLVFLTQQGRVHETSKIKDELWEIFKAELSPVSGKAGPVWDLFEVCVLGTTSERSSTSLLESAVQVVCDFCNAANHLQALELSNWIRSYVSQRGGFRKQGLNALGIKLSMCLVRISRSDVDIQIFEALQSLSTGILSEAWGDLDTGEDYMGNLSVDQINIYIKAFGAQKNHKMLEVSDCKPGGTGGSIADFTM